MIKCDPLFPLPTDHGQVKTCTSVDWQEKGEERRTRTYLLRAGWGCALEVQSGGGS